MVSIYDYSISDLENYFANMGLKPYKAKQLFKWLYEKRVHDFDEMSDISKKVIAELKNDFWSDEAFAIVCEIYYILRRNPDEKFLRKALTWILAIEKVMYNGQQSNTES